jgi:hypothetical protein
MRVKTIQAKHVNKLPILQFLKDLNGKWACIFQPDDKCPMFENSVWNVIPMDIPYKVGLAAMANLMKRGYVTGCTCGCRGDFEITKKGLEVLKANEAPNVDDIFNNNWSTNNE